MPLSFNQFSVLMLAVVTTLHWGESFAKSFTLQFSNDGLHPADWTDFLGATNNPGGGEEISLARVTARHVRLLVTEKFHGQSWLRAE